jgi:nitrite reductase/ring-hydroxylating ferredoxin subunit
MPRGGVLSREFFGRPLVLFRTAEGRAAAAGAFCPHMGAHLGRGGRVEGELLVCPFHGFAFDAGGCCRRVPYADAVPPPGARLSVWPVQECHGLVLVYHSETGAAPAWHVPELATAAWTVPAPRDWRIRSHPQETTENSVDAGHMSVLHGYKGVEITKPLRTEGATLFIGYRMVRRAMVAGRRLDVPMEFDVHVHGLGYSHVDVHLPTLGMRARLFVLPIPLEGEWIRLRIAVSVEEPRRARGPARPLRLLPRRLAGRIVRRTFLRWAAEDVEADLEVWENKAYADPPALARGDGPVAAYRRWCRQFYPDPPAEGSPALRPLREVEVRPEGTRR